MKKLAWRWIVELSMLCAITTATSALAAPSIGQPAPELVVEALDGRSIDLGRLRGKVVIINFWATWCAPCREEMPVLDAFYRRYRSEGVELIGVSTDSARDRAEVVKVMKAFSYPAAMLNKARSNGFGAPQFLPVSYLIDTKGLVRATLRPDQVQITEKSLTELVRPLLAPADPARRARKN